MPVEIAEWADVDDIGNVDAGRCIAKFVSRPRIRGADMQVGLDPVMADDDHAAAVFVPLVVGELGCQNDRLTS